MEIRVLKYFLTVAREENITRAAEILHITQPTLSRQLMQLEDELGTQLFSRGKSKITLTDEGMLLRRRAEEIVELSDKTEREFQQVDDVIGGEIFIGGGELDSMRFLAEIVKSFHEEYPQVEFNLHSGNADDIKERLDRGIIDVGLLAEPVDISKYDFVRLPQKDIWGVVMRKDSPLASKDYITPQDLKNQPILCSRRSLVQNEIASWFGDVFDDVEIVATYNLVYNAALLVEAGMGYVMTLNVANTSEESKICFRPLYPKLETGSVIVWKKHQVFSPATTRFIERIRNAFKD
ncbi:MAG: LysR family transcriptional regulator [Coprobacillus sp.]